MPLEHHETFHHSRQACYYPDCFAGTVIMVISENSCQKNVPKSNKSFILMTSQFLKLDFNFAVIFLRTFIQGMVADPTSIMQSNAMFGLLL